MDDDITPAPSLTSRPLPLLPRAQMALRDRLIRGRSAAYLSVADIRRIQAAETGITQPARVLAPVHRHGGLHVAEYELGGVATRCWWPAGQSRPMALVVMSHGGGFAFGSAIRNDWLARRVVRATGALVASPEYRLAPDHPHPAGLDDVWAVLNAALPRVDTRRVALMGDSAGGFLSALAAVRARDEGIPLTAMVLCYPATDLRLDREPVVAPRFTPGDLERFVHMYLGGVGDDGQARGPIPDGPDVSPLAVEDLSGLPPTLIQVADHDPLERDGIAYAERLRNAGVEVTLTRYLGAIHGFYANPILSAHVARPGIAEAGRFLVDRFGHF